MGDQMNKEAVVHETLHELAELEQRIEAIHFKLKGIALRAAASRTTELLHEGMRRVRNAAQKLHRYVSYRMPARHSGIDWVFTHDERREKYLSLYGAGLSPLSTERQQARAKEIIEKFYQAWPLALAYADADVRLTQEMAKAWDMPVDPNFMEKVKRVLNRPKRETLVLRLHNGTPIVVQAQGMGYCAKHFTGYRGYCKDCHPEGDPNIKKCVCAYCGKPAQGQFAIHRDGFGEGPEVDLCNACGDCDDTVLSCEQIWEKFKKEGVCQ